MPPPTKRTKAAAFQKRSAGKFGAVNTEEATDHVADLCFIEFSKDWFEGDSDADDDEEVPCGRRLVRVPLRYTTQRAPGPCQRAPPHARRRAEPNRTVFRGHRCTSTRRSP